MKKGKQIPWDIHKALEQLQNMYSLCTFIFGDEVIVMKVIRMMYQNIINNKEHYLSCQAHDDMFLTKFLQHLDTATQLHLCSCLHSGEWCDVNDDCFNFCQDFWEIMTKKFNIDLLAKFEGGGQKKWYRDESNGTKLFVTNKNQKKDWKLKHEENEGPTFHKHQDKCLKDNNKLICMHFLIKGSCVKGCNHVHHIYHLKPKRILTSSWGTGMVESSKITRSRIFNEGWRKSKFWYVDPN